MSRLFLTYSILFVLFYSILFYSILKYSILYLEAEALVLHLQQQLNPFSGFRVTILRKIKNKDFCQVAFFSGAFKCVVFAADPV